MTKPRYGDGEPLRQLPFSDLASHLTAPWVITQSGGNCAVCGEPYEPRDWVRATGTGEFQGRECCDDED
jgi:hypothetical protein